MKILAILPVDFNLLAPHVAEQKDEDRRLLRRLASDMCLSFASARQVLQDFPVAYDIVVSTFPPEEWLPGRDRIPGSTGPYGSTARQIAALLEENPFVRLILWTGASKFDVHVPYKFYERIFTVSRGSDGPDGGSTTDRLRDQIAEILTEPCLALDKEGRIVLEAICRRGPVEMVFGDPARPLPARPGLRQPGLVWHPYMGDFLQLLNRENATAQEVKAFMDRCPDFVFSRSLEGCRWMVDLVKTAADPGDPRMEIPLEPVWVARRWGLPGLRAPVLPRLQAREDKRQRSCELMAGALGRLRAMRAAFEQPAFLRRLAEAGLAGYSPWPALALSRHEPPPLPRTPPKTIGAEPPLTYAELARRMTRVMEWLAGESRLPRPHAGWSRLPLHLQARPRSPGPGQPSVKVERILTPMNQFGLVDARAIVTLILTAKRYRPHDTVKMTKAAISVAGDDVTGLMILEAGPGVQLRVEVEGPRAPALLDELTDLFNHRFYLEE